MMEPNLNPNQPQMQERQVERTSEPQVRPKREPETKGPAIKGSLLDNEPAPAAEPAADDKPKRGVMKYVAGGVASILFLAAIGAAGLYDGTPAGEQVVPPVIAAADEGDVLTEKQIKERQAEWKSALAANGGFTLNKVDVTDPAAVKAAVDSFVRGDGTPPQTADGQDMSPQQVETYKAQLVEVVEAGEMDLATITVWDTHAEDNDQVTLQSDAYAVDVVITNAPQTFTIPFPASGAVTITGILDGGGGITLGLQSAVTAATPIMSPGDAINVPVN